MGAVRRGVALLILTLEVTVGAAVGGEPVMPLEFGSSGFHATIVSQPSELVAGVPAMLKIQLQVSGTIAPLDLHQSVMGSGRDSKKKSRLLERAGGTEEWAARKPLARLYGGPRGNGATPCITHAEGARRWMGGSAEEASSAHTRLRSPRAAGDRRVLGCTRPVRTGWARWLSFALGPVCVGPARRTDW